jgi:hypothetical protein
MMSWSKFSECSQSSLSFVSKSLYGFLNFEDGGEHGKCDKVIANQAHNTKFQNYKKIELEPTKTKAHMVV